ncbi:Cof-type HAD-IIB family hydrolase [Aquimarina hainanensis]|uniref:Cof-type HAD-IIB family hydrolase n=1 Tax=Aquimarina hainanensis TaxID=1578017 RepID=A0ABW5N3I1_9FLAO|nr:HAD family hydrolase [Aquimarina sp. TRL1]QKX04563.1 HAD family phosphatase [Aquimarina sp. TRL1]
MDLSQIKLIATDMDGTLLNSKGEVSRHFYQLFDSLKQLGITFVAASGRQYYSIIHKLSPIKDDIIVVAENGALTVQREEELQSTPIDQDTYLELLDITKKLPGSQVILCGRKKGYIEDYGDEFTSMLQEYYGKYEIVEDLATITDDEFLKIAICHQEGAEAHLYPALKHLEDRLKVKVSGDIWLDLSHPLAHKGHAIEQLQKKLNILPEETLVFGDYNNDLEMLKSAQYSFAMKNALPSVKSTAKYMTKSNDEQGVEYILEKVIEAKQKVLL